jgi:hypothetical protein
MVETAVSRFLGGCCPRCWDDPSYFLSKSANKQLADLAASTNFQPCSRLGQVRQIGRLGKTWPTRRASDRRQCNCDLPQQDFGLNDEKQP